MKAKIKNISNSKNIVLKNGHLVDVLLMENKPR